VKLGVAELLEKVNALKGEDQQIQVLRNNQSPALRSVLQGVFHPNIKWLLPEGEPPYRKNELVDQENILHAVHRKLYLFVEGGNDSLKQTRREALFIELLENVTPADAKLLLAMKDKRLPYNNISKETVMKAFPGLIS